MPAPEKIYLQWHGDADPADYPDDEPRGDDVTWCRDKIFDHDIAYVRAGNLATLEAERENLMLRISELQAAHDTANRSLATLEQITAELLDEHNRLAAEVAAARFFVTPSWESKAEAFARLRRMLDDIRKGG